MDRQDWAALFAKHAQEEIWQKIEPFIKSSIDVELLAVEEDECPLGISKVGGLPDLPPSIDWAQMKWMIDWDPENDDDIIDTEIGLGFLAQINFADLHPFDKDSLLPSSGMLYFFYDLQQQPPYFANQDYGFFKVIYAPDTDLAQRSQPKDAPKKLNSFRMQFQPSDSLPPHLSPEVKNLKLDSSELKSFRNVRYLIEDSCNHILGYPDPEQIAYPLDEGADELRNTVRNQQQTEWICLFQLLSSEKDGLYWGATEGGTIYFLIHQDDLKNLRFERTLFLMQEG